jgi:endonuclease/exonuclease/phosphatase family metal-dependent hydrolase
MHNLPWILLGDFNIIRDVNDTTSANPNLHSIIDFNLLITDLQLQDLPLNGRIYTWSNKRPQPSSKLDRIFLSQHWDNLASHNPYLFDLPTTTSDHAPLGLKLKKNRYHNDKILSI